MERIGIAGQAANRTDPRRNERNGWNGSEETGPEKSDVEWNGWTCEAGLEWARTDCHGWDLS